MPIGGALLDEKTTSAMRLTMGGRSADIPGKGFKYGLLTTLLISLAIIGVLLATVLGDAWTRLSGDTVDFLTGTMRSQAADPALGVSQGLWGSFWIAVFTAVIAFPIGIGAAVYLEEYAPRNRFTNFIELNIRNLAGVPSVVYGLLGLFLFVTGFVGLNNLTGGRTVASAGVTLAILVLPVVIITASEAVRSVPSALKEGAYGVGATKWEVIRTQVLPYAAPGILTGTLLSMSRAIGEAAPLILIGAVTGRLGSDPGLFDLSALTDLQFTAMPILITNWTQQSGRDQGFESAAAAAIIVLMVFVLMLNAAAILLRNYFENKRG